MNKLLFVLLLTLSFNSFSQSYLIVDSGEVITTDKDGFTFRMDQFAFPGKITIAGGQFFVEDRTVIATVDEKGNLFRKYEKIPENIAGHGINYFVSTDGEIFTIDQMGEVHSQIDPIYANAVSFGGNYFFTETDLFTVTSSGEVKKVEEEKKVSVADIASLGGRYFITNRGLLYTVSDAGEILSWPETRVGVFQLKGGNFFTDSARLIFTVSSTGELVLPMLPEGFTLTNLTKRGSNYFTDLYGRIYGVAQSGEIFERRVEGIDMSNIVMVSL